MMRMALLAAVFALCAVPALAYQSRCVQPYAPTVPDGKSATKPQMDSAKDSVVQFIKQSDQYQDCLLLELKTEKQTAQHKQKDFNPQIETDLKNMVAANQREKERVGAEYNGAAHIYNELHPIAGVNQQEGDRARQTQEAAEQVRKAQQAATEQARKNQLAAETAVKVQKDVRHRELAAKYGSEMASAIIAGEVRKGMTKEQVLAARGNPDKKEAIPPNDELWHYGTERIAMTNGKVTYIGH